MLGNYRMTNPFEQLRLESSTKKKDCFNCPKRETCQVAKKRKSDEWEAGRAERESRSRKKYTMDSIWG